MKIRQAIMNQNRAKEELQLHYEDIKKIEKQEHHLRQVNYHL